MCQQVAHVNESAAEEDKMDIDSDEFKNEINTEIEKHLKRKRVRRSHVYETFLKHLTTREVNKAVASPRCPFDSTSLSFEVRVFSEKLAVYMATNNQTKLSRPQRSRLFDDKQYVDTFFGTDIECSIVRSACPVNDADFLSFVHKTIQEYFVGNVIVGAFDKGLDSTGFTLNSFEEAAAAAVVGVYTALARVYQLITGTKLIVDEGAEH